MKLKYYGTAAAEGVPGIFCSCEHCIKARKLGGRNIRSRSQALVDGKLLIDFPPDTLHHVYAHGLPLHEIENLIITHSHGDHFYPQDFLQRIENYAYFDKDEFPLNIYGSLPTIEKTAALLQNAGVSKQKRWTLNELLPFEPVKIGVHTVTPLIAEHDATVRPFIFDIFDGEKRILYGNDTGYFPSATWDYMKKNKIYYNLVSLDCTAALTEINYNAHMSFTTNLKVKADLIANGLADEKTVFISHHFSHNGKGIYDELVPIAAKEDFLVSFDGMEVEV